jgi:aspartokinase/homoserine dehydrogenase 1
MKNLVLKFGGTSVGSADSIRRIISILKKQKKGVQTRAVVVSAFSGVTDELIKIATVAAAKDLSYKKLLGALRDRHKEVVGDVVRGAHRTKTEREIGELLGHLESALSGVYLIHELSPAALDYVMSYGERLSAHIIADALTSNGVRAEYLNARHVITTDGNFGSAAVDFERTNKAIKAHFKEHPTLQVVTGFIASTVEKKTTTLGRGGSDYTAAIIGAALSVDAIEIWTDVSGVMTADPRKVKDALPISEMSYAEAVEMSYFGAKVIHPPTMQPALEKNIPLYIKNTFKPEDSGTVIGRTTSESGRLAKGITSKSGIAIMRLQGSGMLRIRNALARLFDALARSKVSALMITQASSQNSITLAFVEKDVAAARHAIETEFALERKARHLDPIVTEHDLSIIAVVGEGMRNHPGIAGRLFKAMGDNRVNIVAIAQGSSEFNISFVVRKEDEMRALNVAHSAFFFRRTDVNVFLVGTGLIGGELLRQIAEQQESVARERNVRVRVMGVADRAKMHFDERGIDLSSWQRTLEASRTPMRFSDFLKEMQNIELPNKVFVDCTASKDVAEAYAEILSSDISIVTPNKIANSSSFEYYQKLREIAHARNRRFLYETNVGAGLPVINTLTDLQVSGDKVRKIEAILSGTLSYIFNNFTGKTRFSTVVAEAREKGYTEPDPRNDLNGMDVGRKILILARELGFPMEMKDVHVESLLTSRLENASSIPDFLTKLESEDGAFEMKKKQAEKAGGRLRYIATFEKGKASVGLRVVDEKHPFYLLSGSDNIIAFTTDRYKDTPLVIKGPGAGAGVTAAGVFADILRTAPTL